jgi:hypothetical protein
MNSTLRTAFVASCAWLGFVAATTHRYGFQQMIDLRYGTDMAEYERVARAAPGLPDQPMPVQHADRFIPHYLIGLASDLFHVGVRPLYYACAIVLLLAIVVLVDRAVSRLQLERAEYVLCIGALVANPYLFRFLAIAPAMLGDSLFVIGGAIALFGLLRTRGWILVAGLTIATLGRSEAVFRSLPSLPWESPFPLTGVAALSACDELPRSRPLPSQSPSTPSCDCSPAASRSPITPASSG